MSLEEKLKESVASTLKEQWTERQGRVVPDLDSLKLGNDAVKINGTVLYADMSGSTSLVDNFKQHFAAAIYKSYLECAARIIKDEGGTITAYDGDRIMAVYLGDKKDISAVRTGLKINYAVNKIINPAIKIRYPKTTYSMNHTVGIDTSELFVSRVGVRNDNDLTWVGRAANHAAKMSDLADGYVFISSDVFSMLDDSTKYGGKDKTSMWEARSWTAMANKTIYRSNWIWKC
ncbi:adenylate/guanylate cyclase domain-containing protein [Armatimonas rosea]|uniref:Class 3 adenylate cyclase n=1 Tax=Armatimonas rosea TaxID=685828 RepID=A0A7W9SW22_ARMRO|nr:adenylate/guanylate cyclase domain-containing protein [Armatimonas rosea]MBB6053907.1 class 3 adenylate cyclase [Armatimonas rosea]